ncbi:MAG TPA: DUF1553 domain-containing protein, partial [Planctomycetaceae bacterium]
YLPVVRNNVYDVLRLMDFPDPAVPNGDRTVTTVAPQALMMMNSDLVAEAAAALAGRIAAGPEADDAGRIACLYRIAYGRDASREEVAGSLAFLREAERLLGPGEAASEAWPALCQVLLASNEFVYVR